MLLLLFVYHSFPLPQLSLETLVLGAWASYFTFLISFFVPLYNVACVN